MTSLLTIFIVDGRKALKIFPKLDNSEFEFSENSVSGHSMSTFKPQIFLKIRVTKDELWVKPNILMAWGLEEFDMLYRIPVSSLLSVTSEGKKRVNIEFKKNGTRKKFFLLSKRQKELVKILNSKIKKPHLTRAKCPCTCDCFGTAITQNV
ncbi:MAG: hypothetical protein ACJAWV_002202 [Flammeovirgaceae bacterium]|jgi:hypothetical protein